MFTRSRWRDTVTRTLIELREKVEAAMAAQSDLDAIVADLSSKVTALNTAKDAIVAQVAALQAQVAANKPLDLTGLSKVAADIDTAVSAVAAIPPAPPVKN